VRRVTRVTRRTLASFALVVIVAVALVSELALRRSVSHTAEVIESLLGLYADPEGERTTVAPAMLADQLTGMGSRFVITRSVPGVDGSRRVYYLTPDMPAKEIATLPASADPGLVEDEIMRAVAGRRWQYWVLHRPAGEFEIFVAAGRGPFFAGAVAVAAVALVLLPAAAWLARRRGSEAVARALEPVERVRSAIGSIGPDTLDRRIASPTGVHEVTEIVEQINRLLERVDRSHRQLKGFTADASHELRTPLTHLRAQAQWALDGERSPHETREALAAIALEADRMHRMVEGLLLLARGENRDVTVRREAFAADPLLTEVAEIAETMAAGRPIEVRTEAAPGLWAMGDLDHTRQILLNLSANAVRYTATGTVTLSATKRNGHVRLEVADTGPGIAPEHLERIFDRFFRVEGSRSRAHGGAGLGLAIARMLADLQGGRLLAESELARGSRFTLELPAAPPPRAKETS